jgi:hypothetical protein
MYWRRGHHRADEVFGKLRLTPCGIGRMTEQPDKPQGADLLPAPVKLPKSGPKRSEFWSEPKRAIGWKLVAVPYALIVFGSIGLAAYYKFNPFDSAGTGCLRVVIMFVGLLVVAFPTFYWWLLSARFEEWMYEKRHDLRKDEKEFERERFKANSELARAFWTTILATYAALLLKSS